MDNNYGRFINRRENIHEDMHVALLDLSIHDNLQLLQGHQQYHLF